MLLCACTDGVKSEFRLTPDKLGLTVRDSLVHLAQAVRVAIGLSLSLLQQALGLTFRFIFRFLSSLELPASQ